LTADSKVGTGEISARSIAKDVVWNGTLPERTNLSFHVVFIATAGVAALVRNEWYHRIALVIAAVVHRLHRDVTRAFAMNAASIQDFASCLASSGRYPRSLAHWPGELP
jgi:hypothetical protein